MKRQFIPKSVAGLFTPLLGVTLLPSAIKKHEKPGRFFVMFQTLLR